LTYFSVCPFLIIWSLDVTYAAVHAADVEGQFLALARRLGIRTVTDVGHSYCVLLGYHDVSYVMMILVIMFLDDALLH